MYINGIKERVLTKNNEKFMLIIVCMYSFFLINEIKLKYDYERSIIFFLLKVKNFQKRFLILNFFNLTAKI